MNKPYLITIYILFGIKLIFCQVTTFPWSEDFQGNSLPYGWATPSGGWVFEQGYVKTDSNQMLITPQLQLPTPPTNQSMFLTYNAASDVWDGYSVSYRILVSSTGNSPEDFSPVGSFSLTGYSFRPRALNLSQYAGQTIYIAFQRLDGHTLRLDDFLLYNPSTLITSFPWDVISDVNLFGPSIPEGWIQADIGDDNHILITPQLQIPTTPANQAMFMLYSIRSYDMSPIEPYRQYQILISTTGNSVSDFTNITGSLSINIHEQTRSINLSQFQGQTIYIAFREIEESAGLILKNVWVGNQIALVTTFPWSENFSNNLIPVGWVNHGWSISSFGGYATTQYNNQMLITPKLQIPTTPANCAMFLTYRGPSPILVSTTGTNVTDFSIVGSSFSGGYPRIVNLSQYEGQAVYIGFQGAGTLDDVWVGEGYPQPSLITDFPWSETFEGIPAASNWTISYAWEINNGYAFTPTNSNNNNQMLITPQLQLPAMPENHDMFFTYRARSTGSFNVEYRILASTTGNNIDDFSILSNLTTGGSLWQSYSINLSQYNGMSIYLAFLKVRGNTNGSDPLYIDDVWIGNPNFLITAYPWSEGFNSNSIPAGWEGNEWIFNDSTAHTSIINQMLVTPQLQLPNTSTDRAMYLTYRVGTNTGASFNWQILASSTGTNNSDFFVIDILSGSNYGYRLQSRSLNLSQYQGSSIYLAFQKIGEPSDTYTLRIDDIWIGEGNLQPSLITQFPWNEDFESVPKATNWTHNAWTFFDVGYASTSSDYQMLITPQLQLPTTPQNQAVYLSFLACNDVFGNNNISQVLLSTTGNNPEDFTSEVNFIAPAGDGLPYLSYSVNLSQYEGETVYLAFQRTEGSIISGFRLDDVWVGNPTILITSYPWSESFTSDVRPSGWINNGWRFSMEQGERWASTSHINKMLITPQLQIPAPSNQPMFMTFKVRNQYNDNQLTCQILVSTTGNDSTAFSTIDSLPVVGGSWQSHSINLSQYSEQIYIAFLRMTELLDSGFSLDLDDVWVGIPEPPQNLTAIAGNNNVALSWNLPLSTPLNVTLQGYKVFRDGLAITDTITLSTCNDTLAINGNTYTYSVQAIFSNGVESAITSVNVALYILQPPTNLRVISNEPQTVALMWQQPSTVDGFLHYLVYRRIGAAGSFEPLPDNITTPYYTDTDLSGGITYYYYVTAVFTNGESIPSNIEFATPVTDIDEVAMPIITKLSGNYPNPFNPETTIRYSLHKESRVTISIYSIKGQLVRKLVDGKYSAGSHKVVWNGKDELGRSTGSGVYFYRMSTGDYSAVKKMLLLK